MLAPLLVIAMGQLVAEELAKIQLLGSLLNLDITMRRAANATSKLLAIDRTELKTKFRFAE